MDSIIEQLVANMGIDVRGSFLTSAEQSETLSRLSLTPYEADCAPVSIQNAETRDQTAQAEYSDNWNVGAILCGDGEFHLSRKTYFGSSSIDGSVSGFWPLIWDSLNMTWAPKMDYHFVSWAYRAVSRGARLLRRKGKGPARPFVNLEGYPKHAALILIKNTLKRWMDENPGFCILIGGPGARARNIQTARYYIRCFGEVRFRHSGRSCVIDAACNAGYLLLGESKSVTMSNLFMGVAHRAAQRLRPHDEGKAEISDFTSIGHLGPVFQGLGGDLSLKKVKDLPPHGHHEAPEVRFNWLFHKRIHGRIYLARLYEAGIVDHLIVIDSRKWPSLIYDSCDCYPLILTSTVLFHCGGPEVDKVKIIQLYEVVRNRRSGEKPEQLRRKLLAMPRGTKRPRLN